ncbi:MAG: YggT family protein [Deltaproteobacteria bacterium]|nr:YggT family protein [Deltaproteobacteria bacterium]
MIGAISHLIGYIIELYSLVVLFRVIISWVNPDPYNPIVKFLYSATEPVLYRLRKAIPLQYGGIDFSPLALLLGLSFLKEFLRRM